MISKTQMRALSITLLNTLARGIHLILYLAIGNRFGANAGTDAVFFFYAPLAVLMSIAAGVADTVLMPGIHRANVADCFSYYRRFVIQRATAIVTVVSVCALGILLVAYSPNGTAKTVILTLVPVPIFATQSAIYTGLLNAANRFHRAVLGPIYGTLFALPPLLMFPGSEIGLASTLLMFEIGRAIGLRCHVQDQMRRPDGHTPTADGRRLVSWTFQKALFQAAGSALVAMNPFINILFARALGNGAVSTVEYTNRLWNIVPLLFVGALMMFFSESSLAVSQNRYDPKRANRVAFRLGIVAIVLTLVLIQFAPQLIDAMYRWGRMDADRRRTLAHLLILYLIGTGPYVVGLVYVRAISALGKIHILTIAAAIGASANALLNLLLTNVYGIMGIGISISLTQVLVMSYLLFSFLRLSTTDTRSRS